MINCLEGARFHCSCICFNHVIVTSLGGNIYNNYCKYYMLISTTGCRGEWGNRWPCAMRGGQWCYALLQTILTSLNNMSIRIQVKGSWKSRFTDWNQAQFDFSVTETGVMSGLCSTKPSLISVEIKQTKSCVVHIMKWRHVKMTFPSDCSTPMFILKGNDRKPWKLCCGPI